VDHFYFIPLGTPQNEPGLKLYRHPVVQVIFMYGFFRKFLLRIELKYSIKLDTYCPDETIFSVIF